MTSVIYTRQSLAKDDDELAVSRQLKECRRVAKARGISVKEVLTDNNYSASKRGRPAYDRLIKAIESGHVTQVIILRVDRLLRLNDELEELIKLVEARGLKVITCEGEVDLSTPQGRLIARILVSVARSEVEVKSARHKLANEQRAENGLPHAGRRAFGYATDGMTLIEDEALIVKELAHRFVNGWTYNELTDWLNSTGITTAMGNKWHSVAVRQMLTRKRYAGIRSHNGIDYPAQWPAIWDDDTWARVQHSMRERSAKVNFRPMPRRFLLTGLMFCGACGGTMNGTTTYDNRTREPRPTYRCNAQRGGCGRVSRSAFALDWWVKELICYRLNSPALTELLNSDVTGSSELLNRQAALEAKLNELVDDYSDGTLNRAEYKRAKDRVNASLATVRSDLERLQYDRTISGLVMAGESVRMRWDVETDGWRRALVELLVERITIEPSVKKPRMKIDGRSVYFDAAAVHVKWKV